MKSLKRMSARDTGRKSEHNSCFHSKAKRSRRLLVITFCPNVKKCCLLRQHKVTIHCQLKCWGSGIPLRIKNKPLIFNIWSIFWQYHKFDYAIVLKSHRQVLANLWQDVDKKWCHRYYLKTGKTLLNIYKFWRKMVHSVARFFFFCFLG